MTRTPSKGTQQRADEVVRIVLAQPGLGRKELQRILGGSARSVFDALHAAQAAGKIAPARVAADLLGWFPPDQVAAVNARWAAKAAAVKAAYSARKIEAARAKRTAAASVDLAPPVHRRVAADAAGPLPFVCRAPRSVFEWGQA